MGDAVTLREQFAWVAIVCCGLGIAVNTAGQISIEKEQQRQQKRIEVLDWDRLILMRKVRRLESYQRSRAQEVRLLWVSETAVMIGNDEWHWTIQWGRYYKNISFWQTTDRSTLDMYIVQHECVWSLWK
jgi:hypothetical protein